MGTLSWSREADRQLMVLRERDRLPWKKIGHILNRDHRQCMNRLSYLKRIETPFARGKSNWTIAETRLVIFLRDERKLAWKLIGRELNRHHQACRGHYNRLKKANKLVPMKGSRPKPLHPTAFSEAKRLLKAEIVAAKAEAPHTPLWKGEP